MYGYGVSCCCMRHAALGHRAVALVVVHDVHNCLSHAQARTTRGGSVPSADRYTRHRQVWCGSMSPRKMGDHAVLGMWVTMQRAARARMELRGLLRAAESGDLEQMEVLPP